jgi:hypothetical protein
MCSAQKNGLLSEADDEVNGASNMLYTVLCNMMYDSRSSVYVRICGDAGHG